MEGGWHEDCFIFWPNLTNVIKTVWQNFGFFAVIKKMQSSTQGYIFQSKNIDLKNVLCSLSLNFKWSHLSEAHNGWMMSQNHVQKYSEPKHPHAVTHQQTPCVEWEEGLRTFLFLLQYLKPQQWLKNQISFKQKLAKKKTLRNRKWTWNIWF